MTFNEFNEQYKPLMDSYDPSQHWIIEDKAVAAHEASKFHPDQGYRHIWTCIDVPGSDAVYLNGYRWVNRMYYVVSELPWGTGEEQEDLHTYIEVSDAN
jgi:hypothetical protein